VDSLKSPCQLLQADSGGLSGLALGRARQGKWPYGLDCEVSQPMGKQHLNFQLARLFLL
jgi:hypothetical protein